jgi:hypothetical protein
MSDAAKLTLRATGAFNQDAGRAKPAADAGPVVIPDRGRPVTILLRHGVSTGLLRHGVSTGVLAGRPGIRGLLDSGDIAGHADVAFDPAPLTGPLARPADLGGCSCSTPRCCRNRVGGIPPAFSGRVLPDCGCPIGVQPERGIAQQQLPADSACAVLLRPPCEPS